MDNVSNANYNKVGMCHALSFVETGYSFGTKRKRAKAVTPTAKCTISDLFPEFTLAFFLLIEGEISEQASRQIATEELNKDL